MSRQIDSIGCSASKNVTLLMMNKCSNTSKDPNEKIIRQTDWLTDHLTDRKTQTDRQMDRRDRHTDRQTDRLTCVSIQCEGGGPLRATCLLMVLYRTAPGTYSSLVGDCRCPFLYPDLMQPLDRPSWQPMTYSAVSCADNILEFVLGSERVQGQCQTA